jgi:hypothetical protein
MMMGAERIVVGVLDGPRDFSSASKMVVSYGFWLGTVSCYLVTSKDPCWYRFRLSGGGCGSNVTGDRTRSLPDQWSS